MTTEPHGWRQGSGGVEAALATDLSRSAPAPASPPGGRERPTPEGDALDPTRYGDWEKNGRCIDF